MIDFVEILSKITPMLFFIFIFGNIDMQKFISKCFLLFLTIVFFYDLYLETLIRLYPLPLQVPIGMKFMQNNTN